MSQGFSFPATHFRKWGKKKNVRRARMRESYFEFSDTAGQSCLYASAKMNRLWCEVWPCRVIERRVLGWKERPVFVAGANLPTRRCEWTGLFLLMRSERGLTLSFSFLFCPLSLSSPLSLSPPPPPPGLESGDVTLKEPATEQEIQSSAPVMLRCNIDGHPRWGRPIHRIHFFLFTHLGIPTTLLFTQNNSAFSQGNRSLNQSSPEFFILSA